MSNLIISINLVVLNGEKYIRHCLDAILAQTYPHELLELNILDNNSTDKTKTIIENWKLEIRNFKITFIKSNFNYGVWPGQEKLLKYTNGKYVLCLSVDVILDKDFIINAVKRMETDDKIGALQPKIYKFDLKNLQNSSFTLQGLRIIDTCGFQIFKSRRVINIGHGELDNGQFGEYKEIFGVEGAAPFFRKEALEDTKVNSKLIDKDFFWYGDDLDLAWRMRLFGWKEAFNPEVIAWHDRQTTKTLRKSFGDFIKIRKSIPLKKRRLDWRNIRWTLIKNDYIINILRDLPAILNREIKMAGYITLFEPAVFLEIPKFLVMLPKMLARRREIMKRAVAKPENIRKWFN